MPRSGGAGRGAKVLGDRSGTARAAGGITLGVEGINKIKVSGINKEVVGEMAANIRAIRPPDPYKGKGIRYAGEVVRLKPGKAGKVVGRKAA